MIPSLMLPDAQSNENASNNDQAVKQVEIHGGRRPKSRLSIM